ncbi:hypothetical protein FOL47_002631 [Perkinsus chesapeaki]|uniref:Zinc transporter n=1 Tax=Perkinsus chesapeaki TaxID=330153 RepID=A0A7J6MCC7_PERCH|nr:hypothetical protein FOL47_002631 [Perkinsus chesapeaki]
MISPPSTDHPLSSFDFLLYCFLTAGTTLIGSCSVGLIGALSDKLSGVCVAIAAGMMSGCSFVLMCEAFHTTTSLIAIGIGLCCGVSLMLAVDKFFTANPLQQLGTLKGARASRAAVVLLGMMVHSLGEGLCLGLSSASDKSHLGGLVFSSIALHNIPEGAALCLAFVAKGMTPLEGALFAFIANLPQPVSALPAFLLSTRVLSVSPTLVATGLAAAAGCMGYAVVVDIAPEAHRMLGNDPMRTTALTGVCSAAVIAMDFYAHFGSA